MSAENTKNSVKTKLKDAKSKLRRLWHRDHRTVGDPGQISPGSSRSLDVPPTHCQETHESNERQCNVRCQDVDSRSNDKYCSGMSQFAQRRLNKKRHDVVSHNKPNEEQQDQPRLLDQSMDTSSIQAGSTPCTKPDLWQRAFDTLEPEQQQRIKSISENKTIEYDDANNNSDTVGYLKTLNRVVQAVKFQYDIDQEKSKIKEPAQKIVKAVLSFQDFIQAAVAFDPTGHATKVWAIVSLGLNVCSYSPINLHYERVCN